MTKREKIINYLIENGIDVLRTPYIIEGKKWQRSGTVVINYHFLRDDEKCKLNNISYFKREDGLYEYNPNCPVEVHDIRDHFEWHLDYNRVIWKGE